MISCEESAGTRWRFEFWFYVRFSDLMSVQAQGPVQHRSAENWLFIRMIAWETRSGPFQERKRRLTGGFHPSDLFLQSLLWLGMVLC